MNPRVYARPLDADRLSGLRLSPERASGHQSVQGNDAGAVSFSARELAVRDRGFMSPWSNLKQFAGQAAPSRLRNARIACLGALLASAAAGQELLSIPQSADGVLDPPPGVQLEPIGVIDTLAGTGNPGSGGDGGPATEAEFRFPRSVALDPMGNIYIVDVRDHRVRRIDAAGEISTFAGTGEDGYEGDGGPAIEAQLCYPSGVATDADGNVYVADSWNHRIRKIDTDGVITTVAGMGAPYSGGDGGVATEAQLAFPIAVALDAAGNLYIAEGTSHRIRRVDTEGTITTFAGSGVPGHAGDGGMATLARLGYPAGIAVDPAGAVYIADSWNHRIRKVNTSGVISTVAGTGNRGDRGDGGPALQARLAYPVAVATDTTGNLYVVSFAPDDGNHRVRKIDSGGTISAFAGAGVPGYGGDGDPAPAAQLAYPLGVATDAEGKVYIADARNSLIRVVRPGLQVRIELGASGESVALVVGEGGVLERGGQQLAVGSEVTAGNGNTYSLTKGSDGAFVATYVPETQRVQLPGGSVTLARDEEGIWRIGENPVENGHRHQFQGREYVLELADGSWRMAEYVIETVAGSTPVAADGIPATSAVLSAPYDLALDTAGNVFVTEWFGHRLRKINRAGLITTVAGTGDWGYGGDGGPAVEAQLNHPFAVAMDRFGSLYVAEREGHRVRKIDRLGVITTFAGTGRSGIGGDGGPAIEATVGYPLGLALDSQGNLFVATEAKIRKVDQSGIITTYAGTGDWGYGGDGGLAANAEFGEPHGIAFDAADNLYIADWQNNRIRRVDTTGVITTFAGTGGLGSSGDGGPAVEAQLHHPIGVSVDTAGNVYVAEDGGGRIRRIDSSGMITTVAGTGDTGFDEEAGVAAEVRLNSLGVAAAADGSVYVADTWNQRVRRIDTSGTISTIGGIWASQSASGPATEVLLENPRGVVVQASGELVFGEWGSLWRLDAAEQVSQLELSADDGNTDLEGVQDIALDAAGNLYVAEDNGRRIRRIDAAGKITPFAGTGDPGTAGDGGPAVEARLDYPVSVAVDSLRNLYVADRESHRVRRIDPAGIITTFAGTGERGSSGDRGPATEAKLEYPVAVAAGPGGEVFIADGWGWRIRRVDSSGSITTLAEPGIGISDGSLATDSAGRVYAGGRRQILRIDVDGLVTAIAGTGEGGYWGDGGPALSAGLSIAGIAVGRSGHVWFADRLSRRVRVLRRQGP